MIKELKKQAESTRLKVSKEFNKIMSESQHNFNQQLQAHRDEVNGRIAAIEQVALDTNARVAETQSKIDDIIRMLQ
jgi:archaellum component FlaC